jgi:hypothetical protein
VATSPGPATWRRAPGLGRVRAARVARAVWRAGIGFDGAEDPGDLRRRAWFESLDGIGPVTTTRVLDWARGRGEGVHSGIRGP